MFEDIQQQTSRSNNSLSVVPLKPRAAIKESSDFIKNDVNTANKHNKPIDNTLRCRYEMKYVVNESRAYALMRFVEAYLPLDKYCKASREGFYPIASLYLDSHNLQLCRESLEGHKNRFKLRIRNYNDDPEYPCFFEIKRRMNNIIIKDRARVMRGDIVNFLSRASLPADDGSKGYQSLKQFRLYMNSINAEPVVKVRYMRRAYEDDSHNRVRITFDRNLCFKTTGASDISINGDNWQDHLLNGYVMEIKFTDHYPAWLSSMVKCFNLNKQSFSKYVRSLKTASLSKYSAVKIPIRFY
jgi:SPX domain protein involved in polyphosphate accumulation